jgi:5-methyltetrahydrofolate--homocysteine methyltransferase
LDRQRYFDLDLVHFKFPTHFLFLSLMEEAMSEDIYKKLAQAIIDGESEIAVSLSRQALEHGMEPLDCINEGLIKGIQHVGNLFAEGDCYLPELVMSANAMKAALSVLEPAMLAGQQREIVGKVVLGTVQGDLHEIGKDLVGIMLSANGFQVIDIGVNQPVSEFVKAVKENNATIVGASALLTTTMNEQKKLIEAIKEAGLHAQVKVMVGGAPVNQDYAEKIGADGYAENAVSAVRLAFVLADTP